MYNYSLTFTEDPRRVRIANAGQCIKWILSKQQELKQRLTVGTCFWVLHAIRSFSAITRFVKHIEFKWKNRLSSSLLLWNCCSPATQLSTSLTPTISGWPLTLSGSSLEDRTTVRPTLAASVFFQQTKTHWSAKRDTVIGSIPTLPQHQCKVFPQSKIHYPTRELHMQLHAAWNLQEWKQCTMFSARSIESSNFQVFPRRAAWAPTWLTHPKITSSTCKIAKPSKAN